jgi:hypothetical protein
VLEQSIFSYHALHKLLGFGKVATQDERIV